MADPTEGQNTSIVRAPLSSAGFRETLELLSKGWVFLLASIYASGYIVVSIYHASLGLNEISPLRPKVAAAGLLFLALGLVAFYVERHVKTFFQDPSFYESESQRLSFSKYCGTLTMYCFDLFGATAVALLMRFGNDDFHGLLFLALWMFGMLLCLVGCNPKRSKPKLLRWSTHWVTHWSFLPLCILTTFALLAMSFPRHWEFGSNQFALYLASVQLALSAATNFRSQPGSWQNWNLVVAEMLMPLILFGIWAYPHTDAASGGGEPTTAEISILPNISGGTPTTVPIKIIDGTDAGFYVIKANDSRVRYIPRNLVTSVSFDKPKGWY